MSAGSNARTGLNGTSAVVGGWRSVSVGTSSVLGRIKDDPWVTWLLETARERLGTDVAYLADFGESEQTVRLVAGNVDAVGIAAGTSVPLEGTFCVRVLSGLLPPVVQAAARDNRTRELTATADLGIGAYVGAPIRGADGRPLGMLCCMGREDGAQLDADSARFVEFLAELVSQRLGKVEEPVADAPFELPGRGARTVFQPIVDISSGAVVAYEALTRFDGGDTATVFARAALRGQGLELEQAALEAALDVLARHPVATPVSINLSPEALQLPEVQELLLAPREQVIGVEITEHRPVADYDALIDVREQLRDARVPVSVDDAGAGYSSLRHVLRLRPDTIKLDAGIVSGIDDDAARGALVGAMVAFAADIGATVVAEGVETTAERDVLVERGVVLGQGWLFGRPGPLPAAGDLRATG